jgi:hypothetical protein
MAHEDFITYREVSNQAIHGVGGKLIAAIGCGNTQLTLDVNGTVIPVTLRNALHAPEAGVNLVSLTCLQLNSYQFDFTRDDMCICAPDRTAVTHAVHTNGLLEMVVARGQEAHTMTSQPKQMWTNWHQILSHISTCLIKMLHDKGLVTGLTIDASTNLRTSAKHASRQSSMWSHTQHSLTLSITRLGS